MSKELKSGFDFLEKLSKNNNREWFEKNKPEFKKHEAEVKKFFLEIQNEMNKWDEISQMKMFRIYRDVRFSQDKTPYKNHFAAGFTRKKPELRGGYYAHLEPKNSFIAVGFWQPEKDDLLRIRKEIEADGATFSKIISDKKLTKVWGELEGEELVTAPKGFDKEHEFIDLLRKKQFIFSKKFTDKDVFADDFKSQISDSFKAIKPFHDYMTTILTTNTNGESIL